MISFEQFCALCFTSIQDTKPLARELTMEDVTTPFARLGLDSLDVMNFLLELETASGVAMGELDMQQYDSIARLYEHYKHLSFTPIGE